MKAIVPKNINQPSGLFASITTYPTIMKDIYSFNVFLNINLLSSEFHFMVTSYMYPSIFHAIQQVSYSKEFQGSPNLSCWVQIIIISNTTFD